MCLNYNRENGGISWGDKADKGKLSLIVLAFKCVREGSRGKFEVLVWIVEP